MLTKTITYTDYNGVERTENFMFNLSKAELLQMEMGTTGGFSEMIQKIINTQDIPAIMAVFKDMILKSYGEKSSDGKRFIKSEELSTAFAQTEAYSQLYVELATDTKAGAEFVNGLVPAELAEEVAKEQAKAKTKGQNNDMTQMTLIK